MDQRGAPEFVLEAFADPNSVRDVLRGKLSSSQGLRVPCPPPNIVPEAKGWNNHTTQLPSRDVYKILM